MTIVPNEVARLLGLRPKDRSVASVAEALSAAEAEATAAGLAVAEIEARRGQVLLFASPEDVAAVEAELAAQRAIAERAAAMAGALRGELAAAERAERLAEAQRLSNEAAAAVRDFGDWFHEAYPDLVTRLIAGFRLEDRAHELTEELGRAKAAIGLIYGPEAAADAERAAPAPLQTAVAAWGPDMPASHRDVRAGFLARLPGLKSPELPAWPEDRRAPTPITWRTP